MNRIYRSIWNQATGAYAAVSENVKSAGKRSMPGSAGGGAHFALTSMAAALMLGYGSLALAGPTGGTVVAGQANISGAPGSTVIKQGSQNAVINWANFNINKGESVQFVQPNSNAVALNRVLGNDGTTILGNLSANGKVFIVNPNGILFGQGASVNTAGLVASTLDISNADFMAGNYKFSGNGTGKVLNQGAISAPGGYVALLGANVSNEGTINARLGSVALAAGRAITLDVAGDGLLNVAVDQGAVGALVQNGGLIQADGGSVLLTAQAAGDLLKTVVNNTGVIEAHTIDTRGGTIKLLGDMQIGTVNASGTLDASAPDGKVGSRGGFVETSAAHVNIANGINVTTKAANGLSGTWLIDPVDFTIAASGGNMSGTDLTNNLKNGAVQILSTQGSGGTAGDINVNDVVSWSANKLTLTAQNNINVNAAMRGTGTASLALEYGQQGVATGNTSVYNVRSTIDLPSGDTFSTKLGSNGTAIAYTVINSLGAFNSLTGTDLQGMRGNLSRNYALGSNIDATATATWDSNKGFTPVGNATTAFTGKFDGLGHEISGLHIDRTNQQGGLFGEVGTAGVVRNVALANASVTIFDNAYGRHGVALAVGRNKGLIDNVSVQGLVTSKGAVRTGGLVGDNYGTINNSRSAGSVVYMQGYGYGAGGLVQINRAIGIISNSSSSSAVNGGGAAGGLVRSNLGGISNSFATGAVTGVSGVGGLVADNTSGATITNSYATGTVTANGSVGGLVGINNKATISNSYASGNVTKTSVNGTAFGGLVGSANSTSVISNSYSLGNVTGWTTVGGIVGVNFGSVNNVYSNGTLTELTSGSNRKGGIVGDNTGGSVTNAYYNVTANAGVAGIGLSTSGGTGLTGTTGLTATQMMNPASFPSFTFTATPGLAGNNWVTVGANGAVNGINGTLPMLSAEYGSTLYSAHQLQLMAMNLSGNYMLGNLLSAASTASGNVWGSTGFIPVGTAAAPFTGSLSGMGLSVSDLKIVKSGASDVGLFGVIGATGNVSNLALVGGSVTGSLNVGAVAGTNQGTISGSYATVGVIGDSMGGGLVGNNTGTIKDSYASGSVGGNNTMGGLAGYNSGTISTSYANAAVSTGSFGGGLVGVNKGTVTGSYWDTATSGQATSAGGIGLSTAQLKTLANYNSATAVNGLLNPAWELSNMWIVYDGQSAPLLRSFMKQLVVTVNSGSKVYDGTSTTVSGVGVSYSRAVDSGLMQGTLTFSTAGGAVNVGTYGLSAGGLYAAGQGGYAITYVDGSLSITARQVSIGGVTAGKVYDGTSTAVLSGGSLTNAVSADLANLSITGLSGSYASKNAGSNVAINATATLGGSASANYTLAPLTGITGNITQKALTVAGTLLASDKTYDGTTAASISGGTLSGFVGSETVTLNGLTGTFADKNAGAGKAVAVAGGTLADGSNGGLASNYSVSAGASLTASITQKALTLSGAAAAGRVYDGGTKVSVSGGTLSGMVSGETVTLAGLSGTLADKNVGTAKAVTVSGATLVSGTGLASNYTVATPSGLTANITRATISSVSNITTVDKIYDANTKASVSTTSATLAGMAGGDSLSLSGTAVFADKNVGTAKTATVSGLTLGGADAGNYNLTPTTGSGTGNITPKAITVINMTALNKVYDGNTKATLSGGSLSGLVGSETLGLSGLTASFNDKNAGTAKTVTASGSVLVNGNNGGLASNYTVTDPTGLVANITLKALTVSGMTAGTRVYDGTTTATLSGGALSGLVSGETLVLGGSSGVFGDQNVGTAKAVTVSGVSLANGTGQASNYTVTNPTTVTGSITQKALTLAGTLLASDKMYDGTTAASITGGTLSGFIGSETVTLNGLTGTFADKNVGVGKAVAVGGGTLVDGSNGGLASNYSVSAAASLTASITQKALTLSGAAAASRVYDGGTKVSVSGGTLSGMVSGETVTLAGLSGALADKNVGIAKAVTISEATLVSGTGLASNYSVATPSGLTADITRATISSVSNITTVDKVYDANTKASVSATGAIFNGMLGGDSLSLSGTAVFADKNVGTGKTATISGLTLGGADAGNYNLTPASGSGTGNITPKAITVVGMTALNKVYDGNTKATLSGGSLSGLVGSETLGLSGLTASFNDQNAGTAKTVTASGSVLVNGSNGGLASNYTVTDPTGLVANITPKALTVSGMTAGTRVYDGTTTATLSGGALSGLVNGETLVLGGGSGIFGDQNVGTAKAVTVSGVSLANGTGQASNYTVSNPTTVTGSITQKALTVSGAIAGNKTYDGTDKATLSGGALDGLVSGETLALSAVFADKNAAAGKAVTVSVQDGSGLASNYALGNPTGLTANIDQKALTVSGVTAGNKTYDGSDTAILSGGTLNGLVGTETLSLSGQSGIFSDKNAGSNKDVKISGATLGNAGSGATAGLASNYQVDNATGVKADIAQKALTVSGATALDKTYDGNTAAVLAGGALTGLVDGETLALSAAFSDKNAAAGKAVTVGLNDGSGLAGNYVLNNSTSLTAAITPKALTVSGVTAGNKTYDGTLAASLSGGTLNGLVDTETLSLSGQSGVFSDKNAGIGKTVTVSGATLGNAGSGATAGLASNYTVSNATGVTANIAQKALTVSGATALDKTYDGNTAAALAGGALTGLVDGETLALSAAFADKNAAAGKAVTVGLNDGSGLAGNYVLNNPTGLTAAITPKALTVSGVTAGNKTYDGTLAASLSGGTLNGLVGAETLTLSGQSGFFSDKNAGIGKDVTVSGATLGNAGSGATAGLASNYTVSNATGVKADIAQKQLAVGGISAGNKVYDGGTAAALDTGSATFGGLVTGDSLNATASGAFSDKNAAAGKTVNISGIVLGGVDAGNYTLDSTTATATADITAKALTVTGQLAGNKVYDGNTVASLSGGALSGLVDGETLGIAGQTAVFSDKNAANGKTVTVTGTTLVDTANGLASNYTVGNPTGLTASITAKALTVTGQLAGNKVYDGNAQASLSGGALSGLVAGETLGFGGQNAVFNDKNAANGKAVTVTGTTLVDTATGLASNYTVSNPTGLKASITAKALTVTGQLAGNKVYDGNTQASLSGGALSGLVAGETLGFGGQTAVFNDKNAANGKTVTVTGTTLVDTATGLASNYTVSNPTGLKASITAKALTVMGQLAGNKVYDGNTQASLSGGALSGLVAGETLGLAGQTAVFSDKNAANGKTVTVTGTTLVDTATGLASNYTVSNPTGLTASITAKALTVTGQLAGNKVYDGNAQASLSGGALSGLVAGETLGLAGQNAVFSDKNAANGKAVTVTGTTLVDTATGLASNYTVSNPTGLTASITAKALRVTGQLAGNKVYDGNAQASLSGGTLNGLVAGETLVIGGQNAAFADKNAGTAKAVTVTGTTLVDTSTGLASNYTVSNPTGLTASITPKALTVAGQLAGNKVYDGTTAAQLSGGVLAGLVAGESLGLAGQVATFADKNAATAKAVTVSGTTLVSTGTGSASNYTVNNPTGLTASITPASLLVRATGAASRAYDTTTNASVTLGDNRIAGDVLTISNSGARFADKNAGANKTVTVNGIALGGADAGNYIVNTTATTTASITQAALGVKVDNAEKDQGRANPAFTASYTGLIGGDTLANEVSGNLAFSTPATTGSSSGSYLVSAAGQASTNYALTYTPGVLTVNPTEALQSAVASVLATVNVAPSQGNMVQAEVVSTGQKVDSKVEAVAVAKGEQEQGAGSGTDTSVVNTPAVQLAGNVTTNVLPGLRLSVVDTGMRLPTEAGITSVESQ